MYVTTYQKNGFHNISYSFAAETAEARNEILKYYDELVKTRQIAGYVVED